jgi:Bacterial Ig-like domain (group 3)
VTFLDGSATLGTVSLGNGQAALKTKFKQPGSHAVTAMYSGDADNAPSTSAVFSEQVTAPTKTKVVTSGSPSQVGQAVTFTATVSSKFGSVPNGEVVSFYDKTTLLGTTPLSGGVASLTTSSLSVGKHSIEAVYSGDTTFESSEGTVSQVVEQ